MKIIKINKEKNTAIIQTGIKITETSITPEIKKEAQKQGLIPATQKKKTTKKTKKTKETQKETQKTKE